jgi:nicotinate-nucleotide pyrophosphorylase
MKYKITWVEAVEIEVEVEADSRDEAIDAAMQSEDRIEVDSYMTDAPEVHEC